MKKYVYCLIFSLFTFLPLSAQLKINFGGDSPLRKLQMAEMAITNFYVDSVNEQKLTEDAIRGMLEARSALYLHRCEGNEGYE